MEKTLQNIEIHLSQWKIVVAIILITLFFTVLWIYVSPDNIWHDALTRDTRPRRRRGRLLNITDFEQAEMLSRIARGFFLLTASWMIYGLFKRAFLTSLILRLNPNGSGDIAVFEGLKLKYLKFEPQHFQISHEKNFLQFSPPIHTSCGQTISEVSLGALLVPNNTKAVIDTANNHVHKGASHENVYKKRHGR